MIVAGASAYSRIIDFPRMSQIAHSVGAIFFVDMAHIAGLIAAGIHPSPVPHADFVSTTTHKTLARPARRPDSLPEKYAKDLDRSIFPGIQGGPLMHIIAAKAVCLKEAMEPGFREYQRQVVANAKLSPPGSAARLPHRLRRHGQSSLPRRYPLARPHRRRRAAGLRPRRHHHQQEFDSLRSAASDEGERHPHGHSCRHHARHA